MTNPIEDLANQYQAIQQAEQQTRQAQLAAYREQLAALAQHHARILPRPLTIPAIFKRSHNENFISDYLAYILDPARNGLGDAPLVQLLSLYELDPPALPLDAVNIYREYPLGDGRIDLLLEWEGALVLGIENKIFAVENPGQTTTYAQAIKRQFPDTETHLIYLSRGGQEPYSEDFQALSYGKLLTAFQTISVPPDTGARQLVLWADFLQHLEVYIIMSDPKQFDFSEKAQLYLDNMAMIRDLERAFQQDWAKAIEHIEEAVHIHLGGGLWELVFHPNKQYWHQVYKRTWKQDELFVHYEYWLDLHWLQNEKLLFTVDVEQKRSADFLELFEARYSALKATYQEYGFQYRSARRKNGIVLKDYPIAKEIDQVAQTFIQALDEVKFLEAEIDAVVGEMAKPSRKLSAEL